MIKHRVEMLPVSVKPSEVTLIREAELELKLEADKDRFVYSTDFVASKGRDNIIMKDRDLDTPLLFLKMKNKEKLHIRCKLAVENKTASQVCLATTFFHVDPVLAEEDKKKFVEQGGDPRVFDNFYIQRSYSKDDIGRPNWIDLQIESIGVLPAKECLKMAVSILRDQLNKYMEEATNAITREKEKNVYHVVLDMGGHTLLALLQEVIYHSQMVDFVSYDVPHPLKSKTILRFLTENTPESVLARARKDIQDYCEIVEKVL